MKPFSISVLLLLALLSCGLKGENKASFASGKSIGKDTIAPVLIKKLPADTTIFLIRNSDTIRTIIRSPENKKGCLLLLHGWNLPPEDLCNKTSLCEKALENGYVLIIPDFGKTTYQIHNFPETRRNYLKYPTREWIEDTFLTELQKKFQLLIPGERNFVYGVSTGGRGAALLALENPAVFKAAACLSADFDHSKLGNEPINNGYYGSLKLFPERWTGIDNIYNRAEEFKSGLFLAHGELDKVCPASQTKEFAAHLQKVNSSVILATEIDKDGDHTYLYWDKKTDSILLFFSKF